MNRIVQFLPLLCGLVFFTSISHSQKSQVYEDEDVAFKKGMELFNKQKYGIAKEYFREIVEKYNNNYTDIRVDAEYYHAICALQLFHANSEYLIQEFIRHHPENPRTEMAYFQMGRSKYRDKKYRDAIEWFQKIDKYNLSKEDLEEYYFKLGYAHFAMDQTEKAEKLFYELLNGQTAYAAPAIYYYAHIAYEKKNYETALKGFERLIDDETFQILVPYYIAQIYFMNGKYEKAIQYAEELARSENVKREAEINRIIGESYFKLGDYEAAKSFLETFKDQAESYSRYDIFQLGYVYYKTKSFDEAAKTFSLVTNVMDTLSQNAYYYMADSYLKQDDKKRARLSFQNAARFDFLPEIKEDAMFQFAKLTYELSYSPFNETITAFQDYIDQNPDASRIDKAYDYLVNVFLSAKNYKEALKAIEKMKNKSQSILRAYQRAAYFRGLELYNNLEFEEAIDVFTKSLSQSIYNRKIKVQALYWRAESYYKMEDYDKAIDDFSELQVTPGAFSMEEYNISQYNLGYCYFKKKEYDKAVLTFRKFIDDYPDKKDKKYGDALVRIGDCYFVRTEYRRAIAYYAQVDTLNSFDKDYALFQEGFAHGLLKNNARKAEILKKLIHDATSNYQDDALFELANSYIAMDSSELAIETYNLLLKEHPNSSYIKKALVQTALLEYNQNLFDASLKHYKTVIHNYPGSAESQEALIGIKNVYVEMNNVDAYFAYVKTLGDLVDVSENEQDQLVYEAAENIYMSGDCEKAIPAFYKYLRRFANGKYVLNSKYYLADCYTKQQKLDSALVLFEDILHESKNTFTEQSLISAARINMNKGQFKEAYNKYLLLEELAEVKANLVEARMGQLHAADSLKNYPAIVQASNKVLNTSKIGEELKRKARYLLAGALRKTNAMDSSLIQYRILAMDSKNKEGAEAKYYVVKILFDQGKTLLAESEIYDFVDANSPHQYWLAKSFLILAQIYLDKEDTFQAKATLQSIIDNYESTEDGILEEAKGALEAIMEDENEQFEKEKKDIEIRFDNIQKDDEQLFEEQIEQIKNDTNEIKK